MKCLAAWSLHPFHFNTMKQRKDENTGESVNPVFKSAFPPLRGRKPINNLWFFINIYAQMEMHAESGKKP